MTNDLKQQYLPVVFDETGAHPVRPAVPVKTVAGFDTPRLHLRPLGDGDAALYCRLYSDPDVMRHIGTPMSAGAAQRSFHAACRQATRDGAAAQRWIVIERVAATAIGLLGLVRDDGAADSAELGLMLLPDRQRHGLAAEAIGAMADRVFGAVGIDVPVLRVLWTRHAGDNAAAVGLMRRLGFVREPPGGADQADWRWQMTRERWRIPAHVTGMEKRDKGR